MPSQRKTNGRKFQANCVPLSQFKRAASENLMPGHYCLDITEETEEVVEEPGCDEDGLRRSKRAKITGKFQRVWKQLFFFAVFSKE
jgi:hypothetical protein